MSAYPESLPPPTGWQETPSERRFLEGMERKAPASARAIQRDYAAAAVVTHVFTPAQFAIWHVWYDLALRGGWFNAPLWPVPSGRGAVVRYTGEPVVRHLGQGLRQIEISAEVRGASLAPSDTAVPYPMTITPASASDVTDYGAELVAQSGALVEVSDDWQVTSLDYQDPGSGRTYYGRFLGTRGSLLAGAVQMRGTADTTGALGRLGFAVGVSSFADAGALFEANQATRKSRLDGSSDRGAVSFFVWDEPITAVHVAVLGLTGYTVNNSGPVLAASSQMLRLTWLSSDEIRALVIVEGPPTNFAGNAGTGSARMVNIYGMQFT